MKYVSMLTDQTLRIHFEAREGTSTYMYIFAEPVTEDRAEEIQSRNAATIRELERTLLGHPIDEPPKQPGQEEQCNDWAKIEASVKAAMHTDELSLKGLTLDNDPSSVSMETYDDKTPPGDVKDDLIVEGSNNGRNPVAVPKDNAQTEESDNGNHPTESLNGEMQIENSDDDHDPTAVLMDNVQTEDVEDGHDPTTILKDDVQTEDFDVGHDPIAALKDNALTEDSDDGHDPTAVLMDNVQIDNSEGELESTTALKNNVEIEDSDEGHDPTGGLLDNVQIGNSDDVHDRSTVDDGFISKEDAPEPDNPAEVDFDVRADAEFLDSADKSLSAKPRVELCAWTLSIRNKVNGVYVERPDVLTPMDKWEVDYSLTEVSDPRHAQMLYQACQLRRRHEAEKDGDFKQQGRFFRVLRELSKLGGDWRKKMDEAEKGKPILTLNATTFPKDRHEGK